MADEKWHQIYAQRLAYAPPEHSVSVPYIPHPICPEHCSGRHEVESIIRCIHCQTPAYRWVAHGWFHNPAMYFYTTEPMNGAPPFVHGQTPRCRNCTRLMVRA